MKTDLERLHTACVAHLTAHHTFMDVYLNKPVWNIMTRVFPGVTGRVIAVDDTQKQCTVRVETRKLLEAVQDHIRLGGKTSFGVTPKVEEVTPQWA